MSEPKVPTVPTVEEAMHRGRWTHRILPDARRDLAATMRADRRAVAEAVREACAREAEMAPMPCHERTVEQSMQRRECAREIRALDLTALIEGNTDG